MTATKIEGIETVAELQCEEVIKGVIEVAEGTFILQTTYEWDEASVMWFGVDCDYVPYDESMGNVEVHEVFLK